jgi:hemolysin activation/secretion protein
VPAPSCSRSITFAVAALLAAAATALGDDGQRVEERLPVEAKPPTEAAVPEPGDAEMSYAAFAPFVLRAVTIDGMSAVSPGEADACARDLIGETVSPIELVALTQCLTRLYRDRGFFLSRAIVPPQQINDGVLKLRAIEGYIASVAPSGIDQADADAQFARVLGERPANLATFERALMLLADRYGHRVKSSQLAPDPNDPARYTFNLTIEVAHVAWRLYGDNRGTDGTGPAQAFAWVAWNSLFGVPDRLSISLFTTPEATHELFFAEANYARGWGGGIVWTEFGASASRAHDGTVPLSIPNENDVDRLYARITTPLLRARSQSLWAGLMLDIRDTKELVLAATPVDEGTRVLRGSLSYTLVDGATRGDVQLEISHGFDVFGGSSNADMNLTRADARPEFTKVRLDASLLHRFSSEWEATVMAAGQLSDGALVSAEEFGGGGARFGRAYDYSEIIGDHGVAVAAELRRNWRAPIAFLTNIQLYAFADVVSIWNAGYNPSSLPDADLSSAGLGARVSARPGITATVEGAKPLTRDVAAEGDRDPRVFVSLALGW